MPERIQLRRTKGWRLPPGAVKVDRSTDYGNPFRVEQVLVPPGWKVVAPSGRVLALRASKADALAVAVQEFRAFITSGQLTAQRRRIAARENLRGRDLACWCPIGQPCHADVLLEIANERTPR